MARIAITPGHLQGLKKTVDSFSFETNAMTFSDATAGAYKSFVGERNTS